MLELSLYPDLLEAGCDEAGRGCLAGPVFAAAVILPKDFVCEDLNDSKQLSEKKRAQLRPYIEEHALAWAVAMVDHKEIDEINILNASFLAMRRAVDALTIKPEHLLIDGNRFNKHQSIPHTCVIKGDAKLMPIAAASVLAKTHRDEFMERIHQQHPNYNWDKNKGYPTRKHRAAIAEYGVTEYHRLSFSLLDKQLNIEF